MEAENKSLNKIFSADFVLNVPMYQRPYSWKPDNAEALLDDLLSFLESFPAPDKNQYFLGSIVLVKKQEPNSEILDGQQRLTTLAILIACLRKTIDDARIKRELTHFLYEEGNSVVGTETSYRLTLRQRDQDFFQKHIQDINGLNDLNNIKLSKVSDSQENLLENAKLFVQRLGKLNQEELKRLSTFVLTRCMLVVVWTPDIDSAFRIFSVLNTRGLPLSPTDIIKSDCLSGIDEKHQEKYSKKWEDLEEAMGVDSFAQIFSHIRMIARKTKLKETLIKEINLYVQPQKNPKKFFDETLEPYADLLNSITGNELSGFEKNKVIKRSLKWLNEVDNQDWIPSTLLYFNKKTRSEHDSEKFLTALDQLASLMMIRRVYENDRITRYGKLLDWIDSDKYFLAPDSPMLVSLEEIESAKKILDGNIYLLNARVKRFLILRLDESLVDMSASYDFERMTIEHVLPQNPEPSSQWCKDFNEDQRSQWTHRIANLVPLSKKKNSSASNLDFPDKKKKYIEKNKSAFVLAQQVIDESTWTPAILEKRQPELVKRLCALWGL